jgi:cation transport ATPase
MADETKEEEEQEERLDRELIELLNELRVILPGIQVLFAFLLTVPFSQRFSGISTLQQALYFVAVLSTAASTVLLIATPTYHRFLFRESDKEHLLHLSNRMSIAGTACLAVAVVAVLWLITDLLYDGPAVVVVTVAAALLVGWLWFLLPLARKARKRNQA